MGAEAPQPISLPAGGRAVGSKESFAPRPFPAFRRARAKLSCVAGEQPSPFSCRCGRGRGEVLSAGIKPPAAVSAAAAVCRRLSFPWQAGGSPGEAAAVLPCHSRALLLQARARRSVGSAGWARYRAGAVRTRQASARWRGECFGPNLSNFFFFLKDLVFCEVNICDLCSLRFLPGGQDAAPDKYHSFCLTGCFVSPLSNAHCTETSMLL